MQQTMDKASDSKPPLQSMKVCVIGAGMAGLASAHELRREGHAVTVLEQSTDIGGQWLYDPRIDTDDPLGVEASVKVHGSMYASLRLMSPRQSMGFSDFPFAPRPGIPGRDLRRFPGHREVHCYLREFCAAFGLMDAVRLNTKVLRVATVAPPTPRWLVRSVKVDPESGEVAVEEDEEVFDAVVVANGHYSQPRLPTIVGMESWRRRHLHSHSYRWPEPFRGEAVVVVGCGESGLDIALDLCGAAREVHICARSMAEVTPGFSKALTNHNNLHLHIQVDRLCDDGHVVFGDGSAAVVADTVIYCTGYTYSFPFLDTDGKVTVDDNRVGPLYEHVFPPALAPWLSFVGVPIKVAAPWFFQVQARWVAQVLSGRTALPSQAEMAISVEAHHRARDAAGVPKRHTHDICGVDRQYMDEFGEKQCSFPRLDRWKIELIGASVWNMAVNLETFRDEFEDTDTIREGLQAWHLHLQQQQQQEEEEEEAS